MRFLDHITIRGKIIIIVGVLIVFVLGIALSMFFVFRSAVEADVISQAELAAKLNIVQWIMIIGGCLGLILGVGSAILVERSIIKPVKVYIGSLNRLKTGDLSRELSAEVKKHNNTRKDEFGEIGRALGGAQAYLAHMADQMALIAAGDLTVQVQIHGEKDELGQSMVKMTTDHSFSGP